MDIEKKKILDFFNKVSFVEDSHTYFVEGEPLEISVSGKIKEFVPEVDFESIADSIDKRDKLPKGATKTLWKLKAEEACAKGSYAHFFGELYAFNRKVEPTGGYQIAIKKFWDSLPEYIEPVFTELVMYHKQLMFGGTADIICRDKRDGKYIILDYKTNEHLYKCFKTNTLLAPFTFLKEHNFSKYELQFSFYQILLQQVPGIEVKARKLVWIKDTGDFKIIDTTDYTEHLKQHLDGNN